MLFELNVILFVATVGMLSVVIWSAIKNKRQPVQRVRAVVLRRRTRDDSIDAPTNPLPFLINILGRGPGRPRIENKHVARLAGEVTVAESINHFITFGVNGDEIELVVPGGVFVSLKDGDWGTLVYQGEVFKHFMREQSS